MSRTIRYTSLIIGFLVTFALLTYVYLGTFVRMIADDYCTAYAGLEYGPIEGVIWQYYTWSTRFSSSFIVYILAPLQPGIHAILPALLIIGWFVGLFIFFTPLAERLNLPHPRRGTALLSLLLTYVLINAMPTPQNIYWFGSTILYVLPLILLLAYVGGLLRYFRHSRSPQWDAVMIVIHVVVVWLLCGFGESMITSLLTLHGLILLAIPFVPRSRRRSCILIAISGLVVGLGGLVFVMTAPGNAMRQVQINELLNYERSPMMQVVIYSITFAVAWLRVDTFGLAHALFLFLTVFAGIIIYYRVYASNEALYQVPYSTSVAFFTVGSCFLLIMSIFIPPIYASGVVVLRTIAAARLAQMLAVVVLAYLSALSAIRHNWVRAAQRSRLFKPVLGLMSVMMVFLPLLTIGGNLARVPEFSAYAQDWDTRHAILVAAEDGAVVAVPELEYNIEDFLILDRIAIEDGWVNSCAANYYQLEQIVIEEADSQ